MKRLVSVVATVGFGAFVPAHAFAQHADTHVMMSPAELTWNDLPHCRA